MLTGLFLQVLRLSLLAGPVLLAVLLMRYALRRAPKWLSCALWGLAALRLVCPFTLPSPLSLQPSEARLDQVVTDITRARIEYDTPGYGSPGYRWTEFVDGLADADANTDAAQPPEPVQPDTSPVEPVTDAETAPQPAAPASWARPLSIAWLIGAGVMVLYGAVSYLRLRRRVRTAVRWKEDLWQCETVDAPFVLGVFRPRVYLPFYMDPAAAEQIVAHERAHIKRHDQITKVFAWLLLSVYWFHLPLWGAYILLCRDIELACDERVIRDMSDQARQRYARALLDWGVEKPGLAACPLAFGEVGLKERIKTVMRYKKPARWASALAVALIAASGVCLMTSPVAQAVGTGPNIPTEETDHLADAQAAQEKLLQAAESAEQALAAAREEQEKLALAAAQAEREAPEAAPILTVRPRDVTADEAKTIAAAIFGDGPFYEDVGWTKQALTAAIEWTERYLAEARESGDERAIGEVTARLADLRRQYAAAPDESERTPCDWTFRPLDGSDYDMAIRASASLDGGDYAIEVRNANWPDMPNMHSLFIVRLDDGRRYAASAAPTQTELDAAAERADGWLGKMGLENWAIVSAEAADGGVIVTAQPSYNGVAQLPFDWWHDPPADQTLSFNFYADGTLLSALYSSPMEVVASQAQETLLSRSEALTKAGLEDSAAELDWRFCYTRVPDADGSGDYHLVPSYRAGYVSEDAGGGVVIVSAVDGSLIADTRPTGTQPPDATPTPAPEVADLAVLNGDENYVEIGDRFSLPAGQSIDLYAAWYPQTPATPTWTVDDEAVVRITPDEDGVRCHCELVGQAGTETVLHVQVNEKQKDIRVIIT